MRKTPFFQLVLCLAFLSPAAAQTVGERLRGHVDIATGISAKVQVPLPEGEWLLIHREYERTKESNIRLVKLRLVRVADGALSGYLYVATNDELVNVGWTLPGYCSRKDVFYREPSDTRGMGGGRPFACLAINHIQMTSNPTASDGTKAFYDWVWKNTRGMPTTLVEAIYELSDGKRYLEVIYGRNPEAEGFEPSRASWRASEWHKDRLLGDPKRLAYMNAFRDWAVAWQADVRDGFNGRLAAK
ncbi:MAG: hypothetical protein ACM30I_06850 [Gemmatimonas sp.]